MTTSSAPPLRPLLGLLLAAALASLVGSSLSNRSRSDAHLYRYDLIGNPIDIVTKTRPGLVLEGGGTDIEESFRWMIERSGGGDFLVIRATGTDAYNLETFEMAGTGGAHSNSVATLIIPSRAAAHDPFVAATIRNAEALWLAGGNQADYVRYWKGTPVEDAIHHVVAKGAPIGGTSSGLSIMGEFLYSAECDTSPTDVLTSLSAMNDPFHRRVTLHRDFLDLPHLRGVLVDGHLIQQDRMGRMLAFLARIAQDGWAEEVKGIGIERETALLVEPNGAARVIAGTHFPNPAAYFFQLTRRPDCCATGKPLTVRDVRVDKVTRSGTFNLRTWTTAEGRPYRFSVENGQVRSSASRGAIYP